VIVRRYLAWTGGRGPHAGEPSGCLRGVFFVEMEALAHADRLMLMRITGEMLLRTGLR